MRPATVSNSLTRTGQCCHYTSRRVLHDPRTFGSRHRISIDYFHGAPESEPAFADTLRELSRHHPRLSRIRVSHSRMEQMVLEAGVEAAKLWRIPIGIDLACFPGRSEEARRAARRRAALPETAVVVGSFQKDGVGWGEGLEPKLIKGPDVLVAALSALKRQVPELHVLLTGPARGYVKAGLERAAIPFTHLLLSDYADLCMAFHALDAYLISSRDEGGPKALLEAMASGVPVVTTRVGQAIDLARPDENAIVVESEDVEGLVTGATRLLADTDLKNRIVLEGRATAEANSHSAQTPLWAKFFEGYVEP